jgi:hypothetical protein
VCVCVCVCAVCRFPKLARLELPRVTSIHSLPYIDHRLLSLAYLATGTFDVYKTLAGAWLVGAVKTLVVGKVKEDMELVLLRDNSTLTELEVGSRDELTRLSTGFLSLMYMPLRSLVLRHALMFRTNDSCRAPLRSIDIEYTVPLFLSRLHATLQSLTLHAYQAGGELDTAIGACVALTKLCLLDGDLSYSSLTYLATRLHRLQCLSVSGFSCCPFPTRPCTDSTPMPEVNPSLHFETALSSNNHFLALRCFQWSNGCGTTLYLNADTNERFRQKLGIAAHPIVHPAIISTTVFPCANPTLS